MKRTFLYMLALACAALNVRCSEQTTDPADIDYENAPYTSYWYYSYEAVEAINHETMGLGTTAEFNPFTVADRGDTLFVANAGGGSSLILFDKKSNKPIRTIAAWTVGGQEKKFVSLIEAMAATEDRLYVSERSNMIHVFGLPDMEYITCIGTGNYNAAASPVCNAQALAVKDGLIFARDKTGTVSIYKEADATPENYQKVKRYKQTGAGADGLANRDFAAHYMEVDEEGRILLTAYEAQAIRLLDPSRIGDDFTDGTDIDIADRTWALPFKPKTFAKNTDRLYATGSNDAVNVYDYGSKEWVKTLKAIKGFTFTNPARIYRENDETFWVSDISKRTLVKMGVFRGEIREYEAVNRNVVKVRSAQTRSGEECGGFYVDLRTHEIVEEAEIE
ncbi:MAG: quinoprotein amine dehydrogenase [Alistipes sp.]|nr:quinoprotein amine dehydrogenase [Alistipes senegalensis]MCM1249520.1 quinoprotein amine dehydrogenase [Alistipes sp.]